MMLSFEKFMGKLPAAFWILIMLMCLISASAHAQIYRWTDEEGNVHFTDSPPPEQGEEVHLEIQAPAATPDVGERRRLELLERALRPAEHRRAVDALAPDAPVSTPEDPEQCKAARFRAYALAQDLPVYWAADGTIRAQWHSDVYRGKRDYIHDSERPGVVKRTLQEIGYYCVIPEVDDADGTGYDEWLRKVDCEVSQAKLARSMREGSRTPGKELEKLNRKTNVLCGS